jgi:hypothetical protein
LRAGRPRFERPQRAKKDQEKITAMTRNLVVLAGLAIIAVISVGSLASARMASTQSGTGGVRVAMNGPAGRSQTDAMPGAVKRDRSRAYWNRVMTTNALDVSYPVRLCATY